MFAILDNLFVRSVVGVAVEATIDRVINQSLFDFLCDFHILNEFCSSISCFVWLCLVFQRGNILQRVNRIICLILQLVKRIFNIFCSF